MLGYFFPTRQTIRLDRWGRKKRIVCSLNGNDTEINVLCICKRGLGLRLAEKVYVDCWLLDQLAITKLVMKPSGPGETEQTRADWIGIRT